MKKLLTVMLTVALLLSCASVFTVSAADFAPNKENMVNIFCGFESGDWMPMMKDTVTSLDQLNTTNFEMTLSNSNAYSGSKSYQANCTSVEGGNATFEWYQVENNKHIYERNGHTELMDLYKAGKGLNATNADYLQFYVKNEASSPMVIKWLALYGADCWELKIAAKYVTILRDGEWVKLAVSDTFITIPRGYEGFIRVELKTENFKKGSWDDKPLDKSLITAVRAYLHADQGGVTGNLYIDDMAFVGKNLDIGSQICNVKKVDEKTYFAKHMGYSVNETPTTTQNTEKPTTTNGNSTPTTTANGTVSPTAGATTVDPSATGAVTDPSTSVSDSATVADTSAPTSGVTTAKDTAVTTAADNQTDDQVNEGSMTWLFVLLGVVLGGAVVAAIVVVVVKSRK